MSAWGDRSLLGRTFFGMFVGVGLVSGVLVLGVIGGALSKPGTTLPAKATEDPEIQLVEIPELHVVCAMPLTSAGQPADLECDWDHPVSSTSAAQEAPGG